MPWVNDPGSSEHLGPRLLASPTRGAKIPTDTRGSAAMLRILGERGAAVNSTAKPSG